MEGGRHSTEEAFALLTQPSRVRFSHLTAGKKIKIGPKNLDLRTCRSNCSVSAHSEKEEKNVGFWNNYYKYGLKESKQIIILVFTLNSWVDKDNSILTPNTIPTHRGLESVVEHQLTPVGWDPSLQVRGHDRWWVRGPALALGLDFLLAVGSLHGRARWRAERAALAKITPQVVPVVLKQTIQGSFAITSWKL